MDRQAEAQTDRKTECGKLRTKGNQGTTLHKNVKLPSRGREKEEVEEEEEEEEEEEREREGGGGEKKNLFCCSM